MKESDLPVTLHIGHDGVTDAIVKEVRAQVAKRKVIKAKRLRSATASGAEKEFWRELAVRADVRLVEVRGHTAILADVRYRTSREQEKAARQRFVPRRPMPTRKDDAEE